MFVATKSLGLPAHERAMLFGYEIEHEEDIDHIPNAAKHMLHIDLSTRVMLLAQTLKHLETAYGTDPKRHKEWFNTKLAKLDNRSPREYLRAGWLENVRKVAHVAAHATA